MGGFALGWESRNGEDGRESGESRKLELFSSEKGDSQTSDLVTW